MSVKLKTCVGLATIVNVQLWPGPSTPPAGQPLSRVTRSELIATLLIVSGALPEFFTVIARGEDAPPTGTEPNSMRDGRSHENPAGLVADPPYMQRQPRMSSRCSVLNPL